VSVVRRVLLLKGRVAGKPQVSLRSGASCCGSGTELDDRPERRCRLHRMPKPPQVRMLWIVLLVLPAAAAFGWLVYGMIRSFDFTPDVDPRRFAIGLGFTSAVSLFPGCFVLGVVAAWLHFRDAVIPGVRAAEGLCWKCGFPRDAHARCSECGEGRDILVLPLWRWAVPSVALAWALGILAGAAIAEVELLLQDRSFLRDAAAFHQTSTARYRCARLWPWSTNELTKRPDGKVIVED
jgi:hypothetical protein